jgi:hypothetical protein
MQNPKLTSQQIMVRYAAESGSELSPVHPPLSHLCSSAQSRLGAMVDRSTEGRPSGRGSPPSSGRTTIVQQAILFENSVARW